MMAVDRKEPSDMLELRPTCENCGTALPPETKDAMICSFECTFCSRCVADVLDDVCPSCGGGFAPRPIRPARNWRGDNYTGARPPSTQVRHRPVDREQHARFAAVLRAIPVEER
jgi:uncharacterized protein